MHTNKNTKNYITSLDGLRAFAVILVLGYHFRIPFFNGGFIGVDIFFVLSGYLITSILLKEWQRSDSIDLKLFWKKRLKRLYPALLFLLVVITGFALILIPKHFQSILKADAAGLTLISNWWYIFQEVPYADFFAEPTPLKHLWSLAVEGQFYLLYPVVFLLFFKFFKRKRYVFYGLFAVGTASVLTMIFLYQPEAIDRIYYGTDTRVFTLILGGLFAFVWPYERLNKNANRSTKAALDVMGILMTALLIATVVSVTEFSPFLYQGGFLLVALMTIGLVGVIIHPSASLGKLFSHPVLRWIGKRSYSLYLWHYPIIVLSTPLRIGSNYRIVLVISQIILSFLLAHFTYELIEKPFRNFTLKEIKEKIGGHWHNNRARLLKNLSLILVCLGVISATNYFFNKELVNQAKEKIVVKSEPEKPEPKPVVDSRPLINQIFAIGDSVILGAEKEIEDRFPGTIVDGKVSRQLEEGRKIIEEKYKDKLDETTLLILELGSNGPFSEKDLDELIEYTAPAQLAFITIKIPFNWENQVNSILENASNKMDNILLIDWHSYVSDNLSLLEVDGVHLNLSGAQAYTDLIEETIITAYKVDLKEKTPSESDETKDKPADEKDIKETED
ncbi:acyltransferase family protein [Vagococcus elongatus]|uniref:Acyltransferase 3 domain-containing protein n=1 Tax=Vagococcus elongatus TaxID=180344 RepID=A0A430B5N6_9ENTE|nr:acyltransferase family protein [Vagococcus elongatus]RSU15616.1 hypothetical protein CBF29_00645 [Vagococcus elongatus]